ncbi:MAG: hypothetical protein ACERKN_17505 [Velocimicrobium sp.]
MKSRLFRMIQLFVIIIGIFYSINGRFVFYSIQERDLQKNAIHFAEKSGITNLEKITRTDYKLATIFFVEDNDQCIVVRYSKSLLFKRYRLESKQGEEGVWTRMELMEQFYDIKTPLAHVVFTAREVNGTLQISPFDENSIWQERIIFFIIIVNLITLPTRFKSKEKNKE